MKISWYFALSLMCVGAGQSHAYSPVTTDVWDVSQGASVTGGSPTEFYSRLQNMLGGDSNALLPGHPEHLNTIYRDFSHGGDVFFVDWQLPATMTLRSFVLNAEHDGVGRDINWRGFSRFTLYAYNGATSAFDLKLFEIFPPGPLYGDTPAPPNSAIETNPDKFLLSLAANVTPTAASRFRAEFVKFGTPDTLNLSPRILELDGFDTFYPGISIPEPSSLLLATIGSAGLLLVGRRRRSANSSRNASQSPGRLPRETRAAFPGSCG